MSSTVVMKRHRRLLAVVWRPRRGVVMTQSEISQLLSELLDILHHKCLL